MIQIPSTIQTKTIKWQNRSEINKCFLLIPYSSHSELCLRAALKWMNATISAVRVLNKCAAIVGKGNDTSQSGSNRAS